MKSKITFQKNAADQEQFSKLREQVSAVISNLPDDRIRWAKFRAVFFPALYFILYSLALAKRESRILYLLFFGCMAVTMVLIFLNLIHEVAHETLFGKKWKNRLLLYIFDLMGANSFIWKKRHILCHHGHQNISGWDSDIEQAGILRVFPSSPRRSIHGKQHRLVFLLYPFYLVNWIFIRDFKDYFNKNQVVRKLVKIPASEYLKLFLFKIIFIGYMVIIPWRLGVPLWFSVVTLFFMLILSGTIALTVLLTPHANSRNEFPLPDVDNKIPSSWLLHQFNTTNDVTMYNWLSRNMLGNFNFHLAHHLFPNVSYVFAPEVTREIENFAIKNAFPYKTYPLSKALQYHYELIKDNAELDDFFEEDM
jgi:linoleoyl-CoA desaturase